MVAPHLPAASPRLPSHSAAATLTTPLQTAIQCYHRHLVWIPPSNSTVAMIVTTCSNSTANPNTNIHAIYTNIFYASTYTDIKVCIISISTFTAISYKSTFNIPTISTYTSALDTLQKIT
jgi:hypothetical protein